MVVAQISTNEFVIYHAIGNAEKKSLLLKRFSEVVNGTRRNDRVDMQYL